MMTARDIQALSEERSRISEQLERLVLMIESAEFSELEAYEQFLIHEQHRRMGLYLDSLRKRMSLYKALGWEQLQAFPES